MSIAYDNSPTHRRSRSRMAAVALAAKNTAVAVLRAAVTPHRASLNNLKAIPLTLTGTGLVDYSAFHINSGWGWLTTGISLVLVEYMIAED